MKIPSLAAFLGGLGVAAVGAVCLAAATDPVDQDEVAAPADAAYSGVCHIHTRRSRLGVTGAFNSTGALYDGRYVITAAHNLYSPWYNRLTELQVACGGVAPAPADGQSVSPVRTRIASGYSFKRYDRDFAVLELPRPVAGATGFRLPAPGDAPPAAGAGWIAGFPGDNPVNARMNGWRMFRAPAAAVSETRAPFIRYPVDTFTGNSGGPVWIDAPSGPTLIGVHVSGDPSGGRARAMNLDAVDDLKQMMTDLARTAAPEAQPPSPPPSPRPR